MRIFLQKHRTKRVWQCGICGKVIHGTRNTIHLGVLSHLDSEWRKGLRKGTHINYGDIEGDEGTIKLRDICDSQLRRCREMTVYGVMICHFRTEPKEHECREAVWSQGHSCKTCWINCYRKGWSKPQVDADNRRLVAESYNKVNPRKLMEEK